MRPAGVIVSYYSSNEPGMAGSTLGSAVFYAFAAVFISSIRRRRRPSGGLEREELWLDRHPALTSCRCNFLFEHDLFGKPASTPDQVRGRLFPDQALGDDAGSAEPGENVGERTNRVLIIEESQTARFAHVVERFQRAPEVGIRMPPGSDAVDRVLLEIPHRA